MQVIKYQIIFKQFWKDSYEKLNNHGAFVMFFTSFTRPLVSFMMMDGYKHQCEIVD
jgi:hypothetical protein